MNDKSNKKIKQQIDQRRIINVIIPVGIPGIGKSTFFQELTKQYEDECEVTVISSDKIRKQCMNQYMMNNAQSSKEEAFEKTMKQSANQFQEEIKKVLENYNNLQEEGENKKIVLILDKNHPPQSYNQRVIEFNQWNFKLEKVQVRIIALIPDINDLIENDEIGLDYQTIIQSLLRMIQRKDHPTITSQQIDYCLNILLTFLKLFSNSNIFNNIIHKHTFIAYSFCPPLHHLQQFKNQFLSLLIPILQSNQSNQQQTYQQILQLLDQILILHLQNSSALDQQLNEAQHNLQTIFKQLTIIFNQKIKISIPQYFGYFIQNETQLIENINNQLKQQLKEQKQFKWMSQANNNKKYQKEIQNIHLTSFLINKNEELYEQIQNKKDYELNRIVKINIFGVLIVDNMMTIGLVDRYELEQQGIQVQNEFPHVTLKKNSHVNSSDSNLILKQIFTRFYSTQDYSFKFLKQNVFYSFNDLVLNDLTYSAILVILTNQAKSHAISKVSL